MKKRIIRNILSLLSVITFLMLLITMIKIDVISTKYLTIFIIIELIIRINRALGLGPGACFVEICPLLYYNTMVNGF